MEEVTGGSEGAHFGDTWEADKWGARGEGQSSRVWTPGAQTTQEEQLLGNKLKWTRSCSRLQKQGAGLRFASELPGHCLDPIPACKQHDRPGGTLDQKGSESWDLLSHPGQVPDSQGETNSIVKVKPELHFFPQCRCAGPLLLQAFSSCAQ